jgi:hypothetical protein
MPGREPCGPAPVLPYQELWAAPSTPELAATWLRNTIRVFGGVKHRNSPSTYLGPASKLKLLFVDVFTSQARWLIPPYFLPSYIVVNPALLFFSLHSFTILTLRPTVPNFLTAIQRLCNILCLLNTCSLAHFVSKCRPTDRNSYSTIITPPSPQLLPLSRCSASHQ